MAKKNKEEAVETEKHLRTVKILVHTEHGLEEQIIETDEDDMRLLAHAHVHSVVTEDEVEITK